MSKYRCHSERSACPPLEGRISVQLINTKTDRDLSPRKCGAQDDNTILDFEIDLTFGI